MENANGFTSTSEEVKHRVSTLMKNPTSLRALVARGEGDGAAYHALAMSCDSIHPNRAALDALGYRSNKTEMMMWLTRGAEDGFRESQYNLACSLKADGDLEGSFKWAKRAADSGDIYGANIAGHALLYGHGTPKDVPLALSLLTRCADAGDGSCLNTLGCVYENGIGLSPNASIAAIFYQRAVDTGIDEKQAHSAMDARRRLTRLQSAPEAAAALVSLTSALSISACSLPSCGRALDITTANGLCTGCKRARYCTTVCQKTHWSSHKLHCKKKGDSKLGSVAEQSVAISLWMGYTAAERAAAVLKGDPYAMFVTANLLLTPDDIKSNAATGEVAGEAKRLFLLSAKAGVAIAAFFLANI